MNVSITFLPEPMPSYHQGWPAWDPICKRTATISFTRSFTESSIAAQITL